MLEGASTPCAELRVDTRLIPVNGKETILERAAELVEVTEEAMVIPPVFSPGNMKLLLLDVKHQHI